MDGGFELVVAVDRINQCIIKFNFFGRVYDDHIASLYAALSLQEHLSRDK